MNLRSAAALLAGAAAALGAAPSAAQRPRAGEEKINQLIVYGTDPCKKSAADEIVICVRKPERERYRIPERLRGDPNDPANQTWTDKAQQLEYVGRSGIGSCSAAGAGGWTGCFSDMVRAARAERATRDDVNWNRLIEQARQERLAKIDKAARAEEEADHPR
jgi:hypothetical protein